MKKRFTTLLLTLLLLSGSAYAEQESIITVSANGVKTTYAFSAFKGATPENKYSNYPTLNVQFNDGTQSVGNIRTIIHTGFVDAPTIQDDANIEANVYTRDNTIVVECSAESNIIFCDMLGRQISDCIKASYCECTASTAGIYIVLVNGKQFKIRLD